AAAVLRRENTAPKDRRPSMGLSGTYAHNRLNADRYLNSNMPDGNCLKFHKNLMENAGRKRYTV
ncbi:MAG: hypothetical protein K2N46_07670, partial [Lachnospiraceae bacterium]|nr:hypothetical protein [Lachnospiraceae bacterium]